MTNRNGMDRDDLDSVFSGRMDASVPSIPGTHPNETLFSDETKTLARLAGLTRPVAPPEALLAKIEARIDGLEDEPIRTIRAEDGTWQRRAEKVWKKVLSEEPETGKALYLLRCEPGAIIPEHRHKGDEFAYVLEGELWMGDVLVKAGDSQISFAGSRHPPLKSPGGCLILVHA